MRRSFQCDRSTPVGGGLWTSQLLLQCSGSAVATGTGVIFVANRMSRATPGGEAIAHRAGKHRVCFGLAKTRSGCLLVCITAVHNPHP